MTGFNGKAFLLGIQHLDMSSGELFDRHGKTPDGRMALVEQIVDEAMLRLIGEESRTDPDGIERLC